MSRKTLNIGKYIVTWEIYQCANISGIITDLGHLALITHLCRQVGVDVSLSPFERLRQIIDIKYMNDIVWQERI